MRGYCHKVNIQYESNKMDFIELLHQRKPIKCNKCIENNFECLKLNQI